ncbi:glycoside hydrolase [Paenibacillus sp. B01]|uniref:glycoside hydrolase n=1 Tax=Paenibacillus sp. B01 TaxID=2660554 RepID=UPI00129A9AAB|nr:glycoside hydrolase [Paenibacillus sp. B01]QGG58766.1 glycoside hydrolase [Paenibacillus sp. B01]
MMFTDLDRGRPFAKDPAVVKHGGRYLLYYSIGPQAGTDDAGAWGIGIAASEDRVSWSKLGEVPLEQQCERNGICAPGAVVLDGRIHLFYQTYGNGPLDAICHAVSEDGIRFEKNGSNPVFRPTGQWNNGRAIDAEAIPFRGKLLLYFATRDPQGRIQLQGVAAAELDSGFGREAWTQACDAPILRPELPWEEECIEAAAVCERDGRLYMFYGGAYNNRPQQIGCAVSDDGICWTRLFDEPFLPNGEPGSWNSSESGHPFLFTDEDGRTYLYDQGNGDMGRSWCLSMTEIGWRDGLPFLISG